MMILNKMNFNFPSNYNMEMIFMLMDYTMMFLIFMTFIMFILVINEFFLKNLINMKFCSIEFLVSHQLELIWSIIPFFILIFICIPTIKTLYFLDSCEYCGMSVKIMGYQWYWSYNLDLLNFSFNMYMNKDNFIMRLLESDNCLILPVDVPLRMMVTSNDVIHSWTIPSAGIKSDAIPGRINQLCFMFNKVGKFFGQCSEICGSNHSFMPINLEIIDNKKFFKFFN